jgi:glycosyltransferase involved in cell wall biosynthesis
MISIIMSIFDESVSQVSKSIDSILKQTFENIEVIIVLDNPLNKSVKQYLGDLSSECRNVKVIFNDMNIGLGFSLNKAIEEASGEFIARMDADDVSEVERINNQFEFLNYNKFDIVFCNVNLIDKNGLLHKRHTIDNPTFIRDFFLNDPFVHATYLIKADVLKKYMYKISHAPEDYDLYFRMFGDGVKFGLLSDYLYSYYFQSKLDYRSDYDRAKRCYNGAKIYIKLILEYYSTIRECRGVKRIFFRNIIMMCCSYNSVLYVYLSRFYRWFSAMR